MVCLVVGCVSSHKDGRSLFALIDPHRSKCSKYERSRKVEATKAPKLSKWVRNVIDSRRGVLYKL